MSHRWCLFLLACCGLTAAETARAPARPNIILIIADDLGWADFGAAGHPTLRTPGLDRLAREGLACTNAFLTTASCSPSRASLITGRYPHNTGAPELHQPLPGDQITFVERLRAAGYWTGQAGKWHLGEATKAKFDELRPGGGPSGCENWLPLLQSHPQDRPFFLWLAAFDPHRPYRPGAIAPPYRPAEVVVPASLPDAPEVRADLVLYYDAITRLDRFVGQLLDELDRRGLAQDTLIVFLSDNGPPFPRAKATLYDAGLRTPLLLRWPGRIAPGSLSESLVSSLDLAPTLLAAAGVDHPASFQGVSLLPLLDKPATTLRPAVYAEKNWHDFDDHSRSVRTRDYLYIRNSYADVPGTPSADDLVGPTFQAMRRWRDAGRLTEAQRSIFIAPRPAEELYAVRTDPENLRNLAADPAYAAVRAHLAADLDEWILATQDRIPARRSPDWFDRETGLPATDEARAALSGQPITR